MSPAEYDEMVGLIKTWWGAEAAGPWQTIQNVLLFEELGADHVFEALIALRDGGRYPDFPPKPPALRVLALDLARAEAPRALPDTTERYDWATYAERVYGEVLPLPEAIRLSAEAQARGVPVPGLSNPWRRPEIDEDAPDGDQPWERDYPPETGSNRPYRDTEPL